MPMVANTMIMATETARALPTVGNPSMMSVWALVAGTPGTSSNVEAISAISALAEPAARAPKPPIAAGEKATATAIRHGLVLRARSLARIHWPMPPARKIGRNAGQSTPSRRPNAAQARPVAGATNHSGWRGVSRASRSIVSLTSCGVPPFCATRVA